MPVNLSVEKIAATPSTPTNSRFPIDGGLINHEKKRICFTKNGTIKYIPLKY